MIAVDLRIPTAGRDYETVASIKVHNGHVRFTGRRDLLATHITVFDERSEARVSFEDDPERWARNLHTAYRTGQLMPVITADSEPNPPPRPSRRPTVTISTS